MYTIHQIGDIELYDSRSSEVIVSDFYESVEQYRKDMFTAMRFTFILGSVLMLIGGGISTTMLTGSAYSRSTRLEEVVLGLCVFAIGGTLISFFVAACINYAQAAARVAEQDARLASAVDRGVSGR